MPTSITPVAAVEQYAALKILKQSQLNALSASLQNGFNTYALLNIVQLAIDVFGDTYAFTNDGVGSLATPLSDLTARLADNEIITGAWTFNSPVTHAAAVTSTSTFTSSGQHRCRVYITTNNQTIANATPTALVFLGEGYDVGSLHDTGVNPGRFTIPTGGAGLYRISGQVTFDANATGYRYIAINKNGSEVARVVNDTASASIVSALQISYDDQANQNDFYELLVYQTSTGNLDVQKNQDKTFFAAMKVW